MVAIIEGAKLLHVQIDYVEIVIERDPNKRTASQAVKLHDH